MTVSEVIAALGVGRNAVYAGLRNGDIPSVRVGKLYLISRDRFEKWLQGERSNA
jgi:excisionase family DNA binding protein